MARGETNFKTGEGSDEPEQERNRSSEDQKEQIGKILGEPSGEGEEEPEEQPIDEETREEEETQEEPEDGEGSEEDEPEETEQPEGSGESEEDDPSTEQQLRDELNEVYGTIEELRDQIEDTQEPSEEEEPEEDEETESPSSQEDLDVEDRQFVTDEEIEEFQDDPTKINDFLNRVFQESLEEAMRRIPNVVTNKVSRNMTMRERAKEFYKENQDLQEYRDFVGHVANEVQSDNPDMDIQEVFEETATKARKRLGMKKRAKETEEERRKGEEGQGPAFAGKPRGSRKGSGKDNRDDQQKQIDKLLDT